MNSNLSAAGLKGLWHFILVGIFTLMLSVSALAQDKVTVKGQVTDSQNEPLPGASVIVKGTTTGVVCDIDGRYEIEAPAGAELEVAFIGYKTKDIAVSGRKLINVRLEDDALMLEEVVTIGYGAATKKQDLSASVGVISNTDALAIRPVTSATAMLQGQIPGVTIQSDGGDPTGGPSIVIRGQGSQNGDSVLWVVDGVPGAPITSPNEIESIVVLKDAASAAIYGAQSGAGGVILVTTKKAKVGEPSISYEGQFGIRQAANLIEPLNAEEELLMRRRSYANAGLTLPDAWNETKNPWISRTRTDWMDKIFRNAFYHRHNVAFNVGTEKFSNRLNFSMEDNQGVLVNTFNKSISVRNNTSYKFNKYLTISEDITWTNNQNHSEDNTSAYTGAILSAVYMPASAEVYNPLDGTYGGTTTEDPAYIAKYGSNYGDAHGDVANPIRLLESRNVYHRYTQLWSTTNLKLAEIVPGLKFNSRFTYLLANYNYKRFDPIRDEIGKPEMTNFLSSQNDRLDKWMVENTLNYDRTFGKHTIGALFSTTADHYVKHGMNADGKNFASESENLQYFSYAGSSTINDWLAGPDSNVSLIARLSYSYDDRYFVTGSWRRDYAGRLPKNNNYGDFPAVTGAWKISSEKFFPKQDVLTFLKVRGSWGRVGNLGSIGENYASVTLAKSVWNEGAQYNVPAGQTWGTLIYNNRALNENLTWETSEQLDFGLDFGFFKDRLTGSVDWFKKDTKDLIQWQTMNWPQYIGLDPMQINLGKIRNTGVEITLGWADKIGKNFSYFINGNMAYIKNEVMNTGVKNADGTPGTWQGGGEFRSTPYLYRTCEGGPLNQFYLIKTDGIFQSDEEAAAYVDKNGKRIQPNAVAGDLKFVDYDGNGSIDDNDRQYMGSATPKYTYTINFGFKFKNLSLSAMLQGVGKAQAAYVAKQMIVMDYEGSFNRSKDILKAWSPSNRGSNIPRLAKNDPNQNLATASDWYLESTSYLRLKNLTIGYDLTKALRKLSHFNERNSSLSVYASGENLFTITPYSGMDPECGGWDSLKYPVSRVFTFGIKLTY